MIDIANKRWLVFIKDVIEALKHQDLQVLLEIGMSR